jgi:hypothetical protein
MPDPKYGKAHRAQRASWKRQVDMGGVACWRCKEPIAPGSPWHLGHADDGESYMGPEHVKCNVGGRNKAVAADARAYRAGESTASALLRTGPESYEDPDWPGVIVRPW